MHFNGVSIGDLRDSDEQTINDSLSRQAGLNLEGALELVMIDLSDSLTCKLLNHLCMHAQCIKQLQMNYFRSNGNEKFDVDVLRNLITYVNGLKKFHVRNMFNITSAARHDLAQFTRTTMKANAATLTHVDMQGFSMAEVSLTAR